VSASERPLLVIALAAVAVGLLGGAVLVGLAVWRSGSEPAHNMTLPGTHWTIAQLGSEPVPAGPYALSFSADANHATANLSCGAVPLRWSWDTDGAALNLGVEDQLPLPCRSLDGEDRSVLDAVLSSDGWTIESDSRIRLDGTPPIVLIRAGG
jgi:hypothetical protein